MVFLSLYSWPVDGFVNSKLDFRAFCLKNPEHGILQSQQIYRVRYLVLLPPMKNPSIRPKLDPVENLLDEHRVMIELRVRVYCPYVWFW
jgi:hypothetical protein